MAECSENGCTARSTSRGYCGKHYKRRKTAGEFDGLMKPKVGWGVHESFILDHLDFQGAECVYWPYGQNGSGYGRVSFRGVREYAHRVICEMVHGEPPEGQYEAAHSCGKGHLGCINPKHLRWATPKENQRDKKLHGTLSFGERRWNHRLTDQAVRRIIADDRVQSEIAKQYGVTPSVISRIKTGRVWKHITGGDSGYIVE